MPSPRTSKIGEFFDLHFFCFSFGGCAADSGVACPLVTLAPVDAASPRIDGDATELVRRSQTVGFSCVSFKGHVGYVQDETDDDNRLGCSRGLKPSVVTFVLSKNISMKAAVVMSVVFLYS